MNKQQAQQIIRDTFEDSFDKNRFAGFIKNLLNRIDDAPFTYRGKYIPDAYNQYIKTLERIGKFSDGENRIDILVVTLQKKTSLERARTMQRNFIAWYLNGSRGGEMKDGALVAFVSPDAIDWRFSLVKMDYKFEKTKTGQMKVKEEFTPARRWSFLVGANEKSHTAQSRLFKILKNDEQAPTLEELAKAFDIETVTKEFFLKYRQLFLHTKEELDRVVKNDPKIKADFDAKGVNTVNFAKKLLGQIIFLYFLQKKGWFGVGRDDDWGTGSKHFLRELFEKKHSDYKNFYNDILEPLFYEALRINRSHVDGYYSRFNCKIPFLNGGLFDPIGNYDWVHTDIIIPDELFSNTNPTKEGDTGDGILDVFDRYNFTVKEDEPLEKEVAIDPELLGKSYEKFNAIRPDNYDEFRKALKSGRKGEENKFNKKFGVYYTPREIVHYMCQQSLINYLHTELNNGIVPYEKLGKKQAEMFRNEGKKGEFDLTIEHKSKPSISKEDIETLIHIGEQVSENEARVLNKGRETRTYSHKLPESIRKNAALIDQKLADITVCDPAVGSGAFPVGMMSEIVRTRNVLTPFLSPQGKTQPTIVIASGAKQSQSYDNRTPYEFKRRCIEHSLYGVDIDPGAVEIAKLRLWLSLVVDEDDIKNIKPLPNLDYKVVCGNSLLGVEKNLFNHQLFNELEEFKPLFFNETNPTKKQEYKIQIDKLISEITSGHTEFDFEVYFSEVFHNKGGFDVVIANPPYVSAWSMEKENPQDRHKIKNALKEYFILVGHWDLYIAFIAKGHRILRNTAILSYIVPNPILKEKYATKTRQFMLESMKLISLLEFNDTNVFENVARRTTVLSAIKKISSDNYTISIFGNEYDGNIGLLNTVTKETWVTMPQYTFLLKGNMELNMLLKRIENQSSKIGNFFYVNYGAQVSSKKKGDFSKGDVVGKTPKGNAKEFYEGKDVQRWRLSYRGLHLDYRQDKLYGPRSPELFEQNKVVIRKVSNKNHSLAAAFDNTKRYTDDGNVLLVPYCSLIDSDLRTSFKDFDISKETMNLKYALAIILSKLEGFYFKCRFATESLQGSTSHTYPSSVRGLLIKMITEIEQESFVEIVDKILAITKDNDCLQNPQKQAKVKTLEAKIDQLVYKLYDLTPEEIKIVEGEDENAD